MITDRITSGGSVGSSIKGAISDKLKAKGTGIKEKFDPLNIARAMTGGGKLAPAILGRMTGRSQADINYFAGNKKKFSTYTKMPSVGQVPSEGFGGSAIEVLNKMLAFMQKNREDGLKRKEIHQSFEEERQSEEERRHNQFLKVLKDFTGVKTSTAIPEKESSGGFLDGLLDTIKSMISSAIENAMKTVMELKNLLTPLLNMASKLGTFVGSNLFALLTSGAGILGVTSFGALAALLFLGKAEKEAIEANPNDPKYKDNPYAMSLRGEATTIGQATAVNQNKAVKQFPRRTVEDFVNSNFTDAELKQELGNDRPTLKKWLADNPKRDAMYQAPVAAIAGQPQTAVPAGGKPLVAPNESVQNVTPQTPGATPAPAVTPVPATTTPVPATPASSAVVGKIQENNDLNLQDSITVGASSSPSVSVSNSSTSAPDQTVTATATTRDDTPILDLVMKRTKAQV